MSYRNNDVYQAEFTGLRLTAFGIDQVVDWAGIVTVYQHRVSPEQWRARPVFSKGAHKWEAESADALMNLISADFVGVIRPWRRVLVQCSPKKRLEILHDAQALRKLAG
jgi:hypothetical protein